jgi:hypothetical protein
LKTVKWACRCHDDVPFAVTQLFVDRLNSSLTDRMMAL